MSFGVQEAAETLRRWELVIVPTETVYGLAGDGLSEMAIRRIFEAKRRPDNNPLILHVSGVTQATPLVAQWTDMAETLASYFWPGPLTLVLKKSAIVPDLATGGLDTVAVRMPDHPLTLKLIDEFGGPIAAPSANLFTKLSPTRVEDVDPTIRGAAAGILDGGPCRVGIESTVLDLTSKPRILRYGGIGRPEIEKLLGVAVSDVSERTGRSPGEHPKHYSPKARVVLVDRASPESAALVFQESRGSLQIAMPAEPSEYARDLYAALARLDLSEPEIIEVERPPSKPEWEAVWDRLRRCSFSESMGE